MLHFIVNSILSIANSAATKLMAQAATLAAAVAVGSLLAVPPKILLVVERASTYTADPINRKVLSSLRLQLKEWQRKDTPFM